MIVSKDAYTSSYEAQLGNFGTQMIQYTIRQYRDVRNLSEVLGYLVVCKQRVLIPNQTRSNRSAAAIPAAMAA